MSLGYFGDRAGQVVTHLDRGEGLQDENGGTSRDSISEDTPSFADMALVGINEVAEMIGVSRTRADQLSRRPSFPAPKVQHVRVRMWEDSDIVEWLDRYRPGWRGDRSGQADGSSGD